MSSNYKDYSNYLQFLAAEYNILYIGKESEAIYDETANYFKSASKVDINEEILSKITQIISKRHISVVVIDVNDNNPLAVDFYHKIKADNEDTLIMLMFDPREYKKLFEIVPMVDATVSYPIKKYTFDKRLFTMLSRTYAVNSIGRRDLIAKTLAVSEEPLDKFFDTYEGSSLFISDDLLEIVKDLDAGNISAPFFSNIAYQLDEVANVFSKTQQTKIVVPIFENLAKYLREIDLESIEPQNLEGFSYLSNILSDTSLYLMEMFVDRIFRDVYLFQDSMQSNIEFMENKLNGKEDENEGELDFF